MARNNKTVPTNSGSVRDNRESVQSQRAITFSGSDLEKEPVSHVTWVHRSKLRPNDYNPNHVADPELELLKISILEDGWTQPIVALSNYDIVDGFHRWTVSGDPRLMERYDGMVPVVIIKADKVHRKMSTIRHNRARGKHAVLPMAEIVRSMVDDGVGERDIQRRLGMEDEEIARLVDRAGQPDRVGRANERDRDSSEFGKEWKPSEQRSGKKARRRITNV